MFLEEERTRARVVLLGDSSVGKTCVLSRFLYGSFQEDHESTIGAAYQSYAFERNSARIEVQFWDTAGQEKYRSLAPIYYRGATGAFIVFDLSAAATFKSLREWITTFRDIAPRAFVMVLGNKSDILGPSNALEIEARRWCEAQNLDFFTTSAKTGSGINEAFQRLMGRIADLERLSEEKKREEQASSPAEGKKCACR
jgi:small GTP-binding protein